MILDTGAGFTVLDEDVAKDLGLNIENTRIMKRPGGEVRLGQLPHVDYLIGNHSASMPMATANLAEGGFNDYLGRPCAGILGYDFIVQYGFTIDYYHRTMTIQNPDEFDARHGEKLAITLTEGMPIVEASIESDSNNIRGRWLIDTGSMMFLGVNQSFYEEHLNKMHYQYSSIAVGFGGSTPGKMYKLDGFNFNGIEFTNIMAGHAEDGINDEHFDGVLGGELLHRFTLSFNYASNEMYLTSNPSLNNKITWDLSGMLIAQRDQGIEILHVYNDSPAFHAGIQPHTYIQSINGQNATKMGLPKVWKIFHNEVGKSIYLKIGNKMSTESKNIVLKDYYKNN